MTFSTPDQSPAEQYALAACLSVLATVMVGLRFYAIKIRKDSYSHDDWWILFALVFTWAIAIVNIVAAAAGDLGQHTALDADGQPIMTSRYVVFLKSIYANQLVQVWAVGPTKLSVLLFYRRIFIGKYFKIVTWVMMVIVAAWTITFFFANLLECIPISRAWAHVVGGYPDPKCIDAVAMYLAQAWSDVFIDLIILVIPVPLIWGLQMPLRRRLAVMGVFGVGIMTIGASTAKLVVQEYIGTEIAKEQDISYFLTPIMYWPLIEAALGITAACLPRMPVLFDEGKGLNKLYHSICSSVSTIVVSAKRSSRSSESTWISKESMDVELGNQGVSMASCDHDKSQSPSRWDSRNGRASPAPFGSNIMVEREFGISSSSLEKVES